VRGHDGAGWHNGRSAKPCHHAVGHRRQLKHGHSRMVSFGGLAADYLIRHNELESFYQHLFVHHNLLNIDSRVVGSPAATCSCLFRRPCAFATTRGQPVQSSLRFPSREQQTGRCFCLAVNDLHCVSCSIDSASAVAFEDHDLASY
jgi:hypothetical protein